MVEELASLNRADEVLVRLRAGDAAPPLFLTHGGDLVVGLPALASRLAGDRSVYGLQPSLSDRDLYPDRPTIADIAAQLVAAVKSAEPHGPYILVGICSGGPVVIEMTRLLLAGGNVVEAVVLVDPRVGSRRRPRATWPAESSFTCAEDRSWRP